MIGVAEYVLRILLIILLVILAVLLLGVLIVLFLPVKYKGHGYIHKEEKYIEFKARWLWGIIRFHVAWSKELSISFKIFWKELWNGSDTEETQEKTQDIVIEDMPKVEPQEVQAQKLYDGVSENYEEETLDETVTEEIPENDTAEEKEKFSLRGVCDKILNMKDKVMYYIHLFKKNSTQQTLEDCKEILWKVWKRIRPKKLVVDMTVGFEGPDTTGYFYGVYCMFSGLLGKNVVIRPDFDKQILDGEFKCKGKIRGITLGVAAFKLYFHKGLRRLIAEVKKGGKRDDR